MSRRNSVDRHVLQHQGHRGSHYIEALKRADLINPATHSRHLYRIRKVGASDQFKNVIGTQVVRKPEHSFDPIFFSAIDTVVGTKILGASEFVGTSRDKYLSSVHFGYLNAKQCNTTCTLDQHRLASV